MKTNDFLTITSAAVATAALTVAIFGGGSMEAGDDSAAAGTRIAQPKLTIQGVDLSLAAADARTFHAGDQPAFELKAVNTTGQPADVDVSVAMTAASPDSMFSRVVRMPVCLWTARETFKLDAGETRTLTLETRTNLPANNLITVSLSDPAAPAAGNVYGNVILMNMSKTTALSASNVTAGNLVVLNAASPTPVPPPVLMAAGNAMTFPTTSIVALRFSTVAGATTSPQLNLTAVR